MNREFSRDIIDRCMANLLYEVAMQRFFCKLKSIAESLIVGITICRPDFQDESTALSFVVIVSFFEKKLLIQKRRKVCARKPFTGIFIFDIQCVTVKGFALKNPSPDKIKILHCIESTEIMIIVMVKINTFFDRAKVR